jgi:hypothetical protein
MDIDTIEAGGNFKEHIDEAVSKCAILIAVVGPSWASARDDQDRLRLSNSNDFVRLEIGTALRRDIAVLPVLVDGAKMPDPKDLPSDLSSFTERQALVLTDAAWDHGIDQLLKSVNEAVQAPDAESQSVTKLATSVWQWWAVLNVAPEEAANIVRKALQVLESERIEYSGGNALVVKKGMPNYAGCTVRGEWQDKGRRQTVVSITGRPAGFIASGFSGHAWALSSFVKKNVLLVVDEVKRSGHVVG